jgi:ribosomal 50S subunit-recycling heat shock protein
VRLDLALKHLCLVKSRSAAKSLCDAGRVLVDGVPARAASTLRVGHRVVIEFPRRRIRLEIRAVPERQLSKARSRHCYAILESEGEADPEESLLDGP